MSDSFEFTLHSPMSKEDWNKISDVEHENTISVTFQTPQGRQVKYIKCEVLDKIRVEIEHLTYYWCEVNPKSVIDDVLQIVDKYKAEIEPQESEKINCKTTKCENCQNHNYCDYDCDYEPQESEVSDADRN